MAILNKTGITDGSTIQSEHVTRTIDALTGVSTDTIVATGSFTGSFKGPLTGTASFATSASRAVSSSFATTASYALNATGGGLTTYMMPIQFATYSASTLIPGFEYYFGLGLPQPIITASAKYIMGVMMPVTGIIVSASITAGTSIPGSNDGDGYYISIYNKTGAETASIDKLQSNVFEATSSNKVGRGVNKGDYIAGSIRLANTSGGATLAGTAPTGSVFNMTLFIQPT
jgi:hypothetical protein